MKSILKFSAIIFSVLFSLSAYAADGAFDPGFTVNKGIVISGSNVYGGIWTNALQSDGKIVIGGQFTTINKVARNYIARLNSNGTLDTSFNQGSGTNKEVNGVAVQGDGKIIIGGYFTGYNGALTNRVARLNSDGTLDSSFNVGAGPNGPVYTLAVQSDGKIIIGGNFTTYNGKSAKYIARLNSNGTQDTGFNPPSGANGIVFAVAQQNDGKIIIAGALVSVNGVPGKGIVRLNVDGSLDGNFNVGAGADDDVLAVAVQSDQKIIIGGYFTSYNGSATNQLVRLNVDGTLDSSFSVGAFTAGTAAEKAVWALAVQGDTKIIVGGYFASYNGVANNRLVRLNSNGTLDSSFSSGYITSIIVTLAIQKDGFILAGGDGYGVLARLQNSIKDIDKDGVFDDADNCPVIANADQKDTDGDSIGDACDATPNGDTDGDGVDNLKDNCPANTNVDQADTDGDGLGNVCDATPNGDTDGDGVDNLKDNCPANANADQADTDGDGLGNVCDATPNGDSDNDGVDNLKDNCPANTNVDQADTDGDGLGNVCDATPNGGSDSDGDGIDNLTDILPNNPYNCSKRGLLYAVSHGQIRTYLKVCYGLPNNIQTRSESKSKSKHASKSH